MLIGSRRTFVRANPIGPVATAAAKSEHHQRWSGAQANCAPVHFQAKREENPTPSLAPAGQAIAQRWGVISSQFLDLLFPPRCACCKQFGAWLCEACVNGFRRVQGPCCARCGDVLTSGSLCSRCRTNPPRIDAVRSVFHFEDGLREAVHQFKYEGLSVLAEPLGTLMAAYWWEHPLAADVVVPVPLHRKRVRDRGYNQSALLAQVVAAEHAIPVNVDTLVRRRATVPQVGLSVERRAKNVAGAFECRCDALAGAEVLLIDDVCTTGSTLESCAVALYGAGVRAVRGLTLSRANFGADAR